MSEHRSAAEARRSSTTRAPRSGAAPGGGGHYRSDPDTGSAASASDARLAWSASVHDLLRWSEALAAIARTGLGFTDNLYERERFEEVLRVAADIAVAASGVESGDAPSEAVVERWLDQVGNGVEGYVTPKVAVGAVVGNDRGEILLVQRADSGVWLYPTGWADIGYSASEVAVKEVREETGIDVEPLRLIAVLDGLRLGFHRIPLYSLVFHCRTLGGKVEPHPLECLDAGWFAEDRLPQPLAGRERWTPHAFRAIRGEPMDVLFDPPRQPPWRNEAQGSSAAAE
jgi:ADP-ribose pyrophosphatase YjhB (NUDIX family)